MAKKKNNKKEEIVRERRCEAGEPCNYYYKCFDEQDNPTENCAIAYCTVYAEEDNVIKDKRSIKEEAKEIIRAFLNEEEKEGSEYDDDGYYVEDTMELDIDDIVVSLRGLLHIAMVNTRKFTRMDKACLELSIRLMELLR